MNINSFNKQRGNWFDAANLLFCCYSDLSHSRALAGDALFIR